MTKSELKTGMLVITRLGKKSLVMLGTHSGDVLGGSDLNKESITWVLKF